MDKKTYDKWADKIDDAKKRGAFNDLSMIAYAILTEVVTDEGCPLYVDYKESCQALKDRKLELQGINPRR